MAGNQGRFLTLDAEVREKICNEVEQGAPFQYAYVLSGVTKTSGERWRHFGHKSIRKGEENEFTELVHAMDAAKARYLRPIWKRLGTAGNNPLCWQADSELLARRCPENFSKNAAMEGNYHDPDAGLVDQIKTVLREVAAGNIHSEEGIRISEMIKTLAQVQYDAQMEPLRDQLLPLIKKMEGK